MVQRTRLLPCQLHVCCIPQVIADQVQAHHDQANGQARKSRYHGEKQVKHLIIFAVQECDLRRSPKILDSDVRAFSRVSASLIQQRSFRRIDYSSVAHHIATTPSAINRSISVSS